MQTKKPLLTICLKGPNVHEGRILLSDFIQIVQKTQLAIRRTALSIIGKSKEIHPGRPQKDIAEACNLELVGFRPGSVEVDLDFSKKPEPKLFQGYDIGNQALKTVVQGINILDHKPLTQPPYFDQGVLLVLEDLGKSLTPQSIETIEYNIREETDILKAHFTPAVREKIVKYLQEPTTGMTNIQGILLELNIEKKTCQVFPEEGIYVRCSYEEDLEPILIEGLKSRVRVSGEGRFSVEKTVPDHLKIKYVQILEAPEKNQLDLFTPQTDPILQLSGLGKEIWKGVNPDDYVHKLREGWK